MDVRYRRVTHAEADFDQRAVLHVLPNPTDPKNPLLRLHLPTETAWSGEIRIEEAGILIEQNGRLTPDQTTVEVIDLDDLWPAHWLPLSPASTAR